jgi:hypothetical protein
MPTPANLVHETSTSTGTGNLTTSAVNGKQRFSDAATFGTGSTVDVFDYFISNRDAAEWERGTGHMSAVGTLVRDTVKESSNANAAVSFSAGTKDITNDVPAATQWSVIGGPLGIRNRIINPSGQINQAGVGSQADVSYDFDQWLALTQSNPVTASQVTNAENGTPYMMRLSQANASAQRFGRIQWLEKENCIDLRGQAVMLSARVRMSASTTLRYAIVEWTGTADSITRDVVNDWTNATFTTGNFFTSTSTVVTANGSLALTANTLASISLAGTIGSSTNNVAVIFWTDATQAQNVTLDIGKVQLEVGPVSTVLAWRLSDQELLLCQRHYEQSWGSGAFASSGNSFFGMPLPGTLSIAIGKASFITPKRVAPTLTIYDDTGASGTVSQPGIANGLASTTGTPTVVGFDQTGKSAGSYTTGSAVRAHWKADARL